MGGSTVSNGTVRHRPCRLSILGVSIALVAACAPAHTDAPDHPYRYLTTEKPIAAGVPPGLCLAVDPTDPRGVWWWEPGLTSRGYDSDCASRSTGPDLFPADQARVTQATKNGPVNVSFRLQTHSETRPYVDVRLVIEGGRMRGPGPNASVAVVGRNDLNIPEKPP